MKKKIITTITKITRHVRFDHDELTIYVMGQANTFKDWNDYHFMVGKVLTYDQSLAMINEERAQMQFSVRIERLKQLGLIK